MTRVRKRIHKLADDYKVLGDDESAEECAQCKELFLTGPDECHPDQELSDKLAKLTDQELENPFGLD